MILLPIANLHILRCVTSLDSQVCQKSPQILPHLERRSAHLHCNGSVRSGCYGWCQYHNHQKNRSIFFTFYIHTNHVFTCRFQDIPRGSTSFGSNWGSSWSITRRKFKHWSELQKSNIDQICKNLNSDQICKKLNIDQICKKPQIWLNVQQMVLKFITDAKKSIFFIQNGNFYTYAEPLENLTL